MPKLRSRTLLHWLQLLQVRLALLGVMAVLAAVALTGVSLLQHAERDTLADREQLELTEAERTASLLEERVRSQIRSLQVVGRDISTSMLDDAEALEGLLRARPLLLSQFDSVYIARREGLMQVIHDEKGFRHPQLELADRAYFQEVLRNGKAVVSEPVIGRVSVEPVVVIAQPLFDKGRVAGIIAGTVRLRSQPMLAGLAGLAGHGGSALVTVTDIRGIIVAHPDPNLVGSPLRAESRLAAPAASWAASGEPVESSATRVSNEQALGAVAGLPSANWLLWRLQPRAEVLAPLTAARERAVWTGAAVAGLLMVPLLFSLWWMLRPLQLLKARAERLFDADLDAGSGWPVATGELGQLAGVLRRVSGERRDLEQHNARTLLQLQSVLVAAPLGILFTRDRRFELVSPEACRLLGRKEAELIGQPAQIIYASNEDYLRLGPEVGAAFQKRKVFVGELRFLHAGGQPFWGRLSGQAIDWDDPAAGTIWTLNDIGDEVLAREQLEWAATHDALTGLANRKALQRRLDSLLASQARDQPSSLLLMDLDRFKPVNDQHGHAAGDAMLRAVAQALSSCLRETDLPVRLGGDEFAVVLERCPADVAARVAEDIRRSVSELQLNWHGATLNVGASIGVAALVDEITDAAAWLAAADAACYAAKAAGRDTVSHAPHRTPLRLISVAGNGP